MKLRTMFVACTILALSTAVLARQASDAPARATERITKEVRHELLMLPYLDVFDYLAYKVDGYNVTLIGQVTRPTLTADAENVVKRIEGVTTVDNQIEVLPVSPNDDRIRAAVYASIYGHPALQKYTANRGGPRGRSVARAAGGITNDPPIGFHAIRIIVENGNVTLMGVVNNDA